MKIILISLFLAVTCFSAVAVSQNQKSASVLLKSGKEKASSKDYYGAIEDYTQAKDTNRSYESERTGLPFLFQLIVPHPMTRCVYVLGCCFQNGKKTTVRVGNKQLAKVGDMIRENC